MLRFSCFGQFRDSFDDGELDNNPTWLYSSADFEVASSRLHSINSVGGTVVYGISSYTNYLLPTLFRFDVELQANPSSANYIDIFIAADTVVEKAKNGYFVRFGDLKDEISLYKLVNGSKTELISGTDGELNSSSNAYTVEVSRDSLGNWKLSYLKAGTSIFNAQGTAMDTTFSNGKFVGIKINQNGTSIIGKHFFDNFYFGNPIIDSIPPKMIKLGFIAPDKVDVLFSEAVALAIPNHFILNNSLSPSSITFDSANKSHMLLQFPIPLLKNTLYQLGNVGSQDLKGNTSKNHTLPFYSLYVDTPQYGDIILSEIMSTPSPSIGILPEIEYLEIKNTTANFLRLNRCKLTDAVSSHYLPDTILPPYAYALITKNSNISLQLPGILWIGASSFPNLNNDADDLALYNQYGNEVQSVSYSNLWHSSTLKRSGGWSLELIDTQFSCLGKENWASNNTVGGTPGKSNSVAAKLTELPVFDWKRSYCLSNHSVRIFFTHDPDSVGISPAIIHGPQTLGNITQINNFNHQQHSLDISFQNNLIPDTVYYLKIDAISCCFGLKIENAAIPFGLGNNQIKQGDLFINEILFNPLADDPDYVEIVNTSSHILDLKQTQILNFKENNVPDQYVPIAPNGYVLFPGEFAVICTKPDAIMQRYPYHSGRAFITTSSTPTFPNDRGHVGIADNFGNLIDDFEYLDKYHSPILSNTEGVSLEKIQPTGPSSQEQMWTSAAQSIGFGTPGLPNSQLQSFKETNEIELLQNWFSPDDDGNSDLAILNYHLDHAGYLITATVYAETGDFIAEICKNISTSQSGQLSWDGAVSSGVVPQGNYVIILEGFHPSGKTLNKKFTISVLK